MALGLAANVVQFIDFVSRLISSTVEFARSADGTDGQILELESVYNSLSTLSSSLRTNQAGAGNNSNNSTIQGIEQFATTRIDPVRRPAIESHVRNLERLAQECDALCEKLLDLIRGFRVKGTAWRPVKTFAQALNLAWGRRRIKELEESLARYQREIVLHFFPLLRYNPPSVGKPSPDDLMLLQ